MDISPSLKTSGVLDTYFELLKTGGVHDYPSFDYPGDENTKPGTYSSHAAALTRDTLYVEFTNITEQKKAEEDIKVRTEELERINTLMVDRELKMSELKAENETLKKKLEGQA